MNPPLQEAWRIRQGFGQLPVVDAGLVFIGLDDPRSRAEKDWPWSKRSTAALELETGRSVWRHRQSLPKALSSDAVLVGLTGRAGGLAILSPKTGEERGALPGPVRVRRAAEVDGRFVGEDHRDGAPSLYAVDLESREVLWERRFPEVRAFRGVFAATSGRVVFGTEDGEVVALALDGGGDTWRHSVAGLPGAAQGAITIDGDDVVLATGWHVVKLSLADGKRRWSCRLEKGVSAGYCYQDAYHVLSAQGVYSRVNLQTGGVLSSRDLTSQLPHKRGMGGVSPPILVSDTHVFTGNQGGYICAFERDTAKFAWCGRPEGGRSTEMADNYFVVVDGRLLYLDQSMTVYCLEQAGSGRKSQRYDSGSSARTRKKTAAVHRRKR